jgi:hypothetical protein
MGCVCTSGGMYGMLSQHRMSVACIRVCVSDSALSACLLLVGGSFGELRRQLRTCRLEGAGTAGRCDTAHLVS